MDVEDRSTGRLELVAGFGFALRAGVLGFGLLGTWLAQPGFDHPVAYVLLAIAPVAAALHPRGVMPTATVALMLALLLLDGYLTDTVAPWLAIAVGVCGYLTHACAAMAALWRSDTEADPAIWRDWLRRVVGVVALSAVLAAVVTAVSRQPIVAPPAVLVAVAAGVALAVVGVVTWLYHRRVP